MSPEFLILVESCLLSLEESAVPISSLAVRERIREIEGPNFYALSYVRRGIQTVRPNLIFSDTGLTHRQISSFKVMAHSDRHLEELMQLASYRLELQPLSVITLVKPPVPLGVALETFHWYWYRISIPNSEVEACKEKLSRLERHDLIGGFYLL